MGKNTGKVALTLMAAGMLVAGGSLATAQQTTGTSTTQNQTTTQSQDTNRDSNRSTSQGTGQGSSTGTDRSTGSSTTGQSTGSGTSQSGSMSAGQSMLSSDDRKFIMNAAMGGMTEVEAGRLAAEKGSSDAVKRIGQQIVDDHTKANDELMQLAASKGVTLPKELDTKHRAKITKLSNLSGAEFDRMYIMEMMKDHKKDVAMFQKQSERGRDAELKAFAAKTLPVLQGHTREIESAHSSMPSTSGSGAPSDTTPGSSSTSGTSTTPSSGTTSGSGATSGSGTTTGTTTKPKP